MELTTFRVVLVGNFQEQGNVWKGSPVFPDGMFQTEIRVPYFFKAMFGTNTFQIFVPFFRWVELIFQMVNAIPGRNLLVLNFA